MVCRPNDLLRDFSESPGAEGCTVLVVEIRITRLQLSTKGLEQAAFQEFEEIQMICEGECQFLSGAPASNDSSPLESRERS
jgi:hypothetical protein